MTNYLGIPVPKFGLTEVIPPITHTVNQYGTLGLRSIPDNVPPGSHIRVMGLYDHAPQGYDMVELNGTPDKPIFITGDETTKFTRELYIKGSNVIMDNVTFAKHPTLNQPWGVGSLWIWASNFCVRNSAFLGNDYGGGIKIANHVSPISQITICNNVIVECGDANASFDQDCHGIVVGKNTERLWILNNEIKHCSGDGIQVNATYGYETKLHHVYIAGNNLHHNKQAGCALKECVDVIVSENTSHDHYPVGATPSSPGANLHYQYNCKRVWFLKNYLHSSVFGIAGGSDNGDSDELFFIKNDVANAKHAQAYPYDARDLWSSAAFRTKGGKTKYFINNGVADCDGGIHSPGNGNVLLSGTIFIDMSNPFGPVRSDGLIQHLTPEGEKQVFERFRTLYGIDISGTPPVVQKYKAWRDDATGAVCLSKTPLTNSTEAPWLNEP